MDARVSSGAKSSRIFRNAPWVGLCTLVFFCSSPVTPRDHGAAFTLPSLESLEGCLQLRYAVQAALARRDFETEKNQPPGI
jgi:hypothetical protein